MRLGDGLRWVTGAAMFFGAAETSAHDISSEAQARLANGTGWEYLLTGAEHMLTGYDHLLFLLGVVFFLHRFVDILKFVTAFTFAHTLVLLLATLARISADHHLIDAAIAASVIYKGFENLGGFERLLGFRAPRLLVMVFLFGLIHGFGLSAQLQTLTLAEDPKLVSRILWFSLGVEMGQVLALCFMVPVIAAWRRTRIWTPLSRTLNGMLILLGFLLLLFQLHGYQHRHDALDHHAPEPSEKTQSWHRHGDEPAHFH